MDQLRRVRAFVVVGVSALLIEPLTGGNLDRTTWLIGLTIAGIGMVVAATVALWHGPMAVETGGGVLWVGGIALIRHGSGGAGGGYSLLLLLPVLWFALYASRRQLRLIIAAVAVALAVPLLFVAGAAYPSAGWRGALLLSVCGAMCGLSAQALRDRLAERSREVATKAAELEATLEAIADPVARYVTVRDDAGRAVDLRCVYLNQAGREMLGIETVGELLSTRAQDRGDDELVEEWLAAVDAAAPSRVETRSRRWRPGRVLTLQLNRVADGLLASWRDVTAERGAENDLRRSMQRWQSFADAAADVSMVVDPNFEVVHVSTSIGELLGIAEADAVGENVLQVVHPDDREWVRATLAAALGDDERRVIEFRLLGGHAPDAEVWLEARLAGIARDAGREITISLRDVTIAHLEWTLLAHQATHDPLTGLLNRAGLQGELERNGRSRSGGDFLLYVDLDRFKPINDEHGHAAGDQVLVEISRRLSAVVRTGDVVARIGGDEFAVFGGLSDVPLDIAALVDRLQLVIAAPIVLAGGALVAVGASVGAAIAQSAGTVDDLLIAADHDMYRSKRDVPHEPVGTGEEAGPAITSAR
ncbi:MAG: diguanylate cyclase [Ilumatobacteraceae bacterium]|nr:diguanylate cyclase [Ilumatobacteraceae bacterium]